MALSVGSPRPAVSGHPVRWSSDFPPSRQRRDGGRPAILDSYILTSEEGSRSRSARRSWAEGLYQHFHGIVADDDLRDVLEKETLLIVEVERIPAIYGRLDVNRTL